MFKHCLDNSSSQTFIFWRLHFWLGLFHRLPCVFDLVALFLTPLVWTIQFLGVMLYPLHPLGHLSFYLYSQQEPTHHVQLARSQLATWFGFADTMEAIEATPETSSVHTASTFIDATADPDLATTDNNQFSS